MISVVIPRLSVLPLCVVCRNNRRMVRTPGNHLYVILMEQYGIQAACYKCDMQDIRRTVLLGTMEGQMSPSPGIA